MAITSRKFFLRRSKMLDFLDQLEETADNDVTSVYMLPRLSVSEIEDLLGKIRIESTPGEMIQMAANSKNGAVLFWGSVKKCLILPPFPLTIICSASSRISWGFI